MSKIAIQVPIKGAQSERVPGKNFRMIAGKPLYAWMISELLRLRPLGFDCDVFIDSESPDVLKRVCEYFHDSGLKVNLRHPRLAGPRANGNHLLNAFSQYQTQYDIYCQAFVTAPLLRAETMAAGIRAVLSPLENYDSALTVTHETGFFWFNDNPVNQAIGRMDGLPRTQDARVVKETTGFYAIDADALFASGCRIGRNACFVNTPREEATDIDTEDDFKEAERLLLARQ